MDAEMPEEVSMQARNILPPDGPPDPQGGRPRVPNRTVLAVLWYVLVAGVRWKDVPRAFGGSGRTAHRRLQPWRKLGLFGSLHQLFLDALRRAGKLSADTVILDSFHVRAHGGGELTGPNPTDRRKKGSKHTVLVDERGTPLVILTCGSHVSDHGQILPAVLAFPKIRGKTGTHKTRPRKLYADRGYDSAAARAILRWLGITAVIAQRNREHGSGLGKVRWVMERTISWLKGMRRMRLRYDRLAMMQMAWNALAASVIRFRLLE
jgi:transposase